MPESHGSEANPENQRIPISGKSGHNNIEVSKVLLPLLDSAQGVFIPYNTKILGMFCPLAIRKQTETQNVVLVTAASVHGTS